MYLILVIILVGSTNAGPIHVEQKVADNDFEKLDNYLPKFGEFPKYHYSTFGDNALSDDDSLNLIEFKSSQKEDPRTFGGILDVVKEGATAGMELLKEMKNMIMSTLKPETNTTQEETTTPANEITDAEVTTQILDEKNQPDPILEDDSNNANRTARQEDLDENSIEVDKDTNNTKEKESQEEDEEEEEPNMITGLISAFLGGLSRPDGSVDVEAITGLLGSLSTQNADGTYDFNGLTELLMSFFGGGDEEGGGSNFGAFLGGLAGAFLKGIANPPGSKGVGIFSGNFLNAILPAVFAPAPTEEGETQKPPQQLDSGGFIAGFLSTIFGNLGNLSGSSGSGGDQGGGGGNKFSLFKAIFSMITSVFSSSSAAH